MQPKVSVIIAVYNAIPYLELVLAGYCRQSFSDFEIVIADDGSGPEMSAFIRRFSRSSPVGIQYISQPDAGFRKCKILNEGIRTSLANYLVFADADCIPHTRFVQAHYDCSSNNGVLCGRRVNLSRRVSEKLTVQEVLLGKVEKSVLSLICNGLLGRINHWEDGMFLRSPALRSLLSRKKPVLFGCNFSAPKPLLERVNGFNEDFTDYWGEDTELQYRLERAGAHFEWVRQHAIQYHLHHVQRSAATASEALLQRARVEGMIECRNGLRKLE